MRILLLITMLALFVASCHQRLVNKGDYEFEHMSYDKAIQSYEKALTKKEKPETHIKAAEAYEQMNNTKEAEEHYRIALTSDSDEIAHRYKYNFAHALMANGKREEALEWMAKYIEAHPEDIGAKEWLDAEAHQGEYAVFKPSRVQVDMIPLTDYVSAFGAFPSPRGVYFVGERKAEKGDKVNPWTGHSFLDVYHVASAGDKEWYDSHLAEGEVNAGLHDGPICIDHTGDIAYVTKSALSDKQTQKFDKKKVNQLKIVQYAFKDGSWKHIQEMPFNEAHSSSMHATVTNDGNTLIFASDRKGGYGGVDLYVTEFNGQEWSEPKNMGADINSTEDDVFPFALDSDTLFFASNGHGGMGGLDVFIAINENGTWRHPVNLKAPINTHSDDFAFYRTKEGMGGYFSSNRAGKDDIYSWGVEDPEFLLVGAVYDLDKDPVADAKVVLKEDGKVVDSTKTSSSGSFEMPLDWKKDYEVTGKKETQKTDTVTASTQGKEDSETLNVELELEAPEFWVRGFVVDKETKEKLTDATVELMGAGDKIVGTTHTDDKGGFVFKLDRNSKYYIYGLKKNYFTRKEDVSVSTQGLKYTETFDVVVELEKVVVEKPIVLKNIYYDYDKWDIRPDAVGDLDNLLFYLQKHPGAQIELSSHTDSRGTKKYNYTLSGKRALSAVNYLASRGIKLEMMVKKGYGENQLVNKCKDGVECTEEEHQENRRTEFKVLKLD